MKTFNARDILKLTPDEVMTLDPVFILHFDDGDMKVTREHTFFSRFFWEFHKEFDRTPLLKSHHLEYILEDKDYASDTHSALCESIQKSILQTYGTSVPLINRRIAKLVKFYTNDMTNGMTKYASSHVSSITLEDIIQVTRHPSIQAALKRLKNNEVLPEYVTDAAHKVLMEDPVCSLTGLGIAYRAKSIKRNQCLQAVATIGIRTEADGAIFDWSVPSGYGEGITEIAEFFADSRSAPKALKSAEGPIQDSDYLSRRLKLVANCVKRVEHEDCGTHETLHWLVLPEEQDEFGNIIRPSGVSALAGRYYYDEDNNLKRINGHERELEGKYIRLRSIIKCKNHDPHTVCKRCFGDLWYNLQEVTNVGYNCVVTIMERIIQLTLSTKHVVGSAVGEGIRLNGTVANYFKVGKRNNHFYLQNALKKKNLRIVIPRIAISGLEGLKEEELEDIIPAQISRIPKVMLIMNNQGSEQTEIVDLMQGNRFVFMTEEFIRYAVKHQWKIDEEANYEFDLSEWDYHNGIFALPEMEVSFAEKGTEIGKLIESNMKEIGERYKPESVHKTLSELYDLVSRSLDIPLTCLEVLIYANTIYAPDDYRLGRHSPAPVLGIARNIIMNRSLSNAMAFESLTDVIFNPRSFFKEGRPDSQMDVFFDPKEYVHRFEKGLIQR